MTAEYTVTCWRPFIHEHYNDERKARDRYAELLVKYPKQDIEFVKQENYEQIH